MAKAKSLTTIHNLYKKSFKIAKLKGVGKFKAKKVKLPKFKKVKKSI